MTPEQKKIQELEAKLEQMQREMKKAQTRADALQSQVLNLHATSRSFLDVIVESLVILQSKYPMDAQFQKELWERITASLDKAALDLSREKFFRRFSEKRKSFLKATVLTSFFSFCTFGAKSTKSLRTSFSAGGYAPRRCPGCARSEPMRHPVTAAPRAAPSSSASNESADLLCRRWRQCV